MKKRKRIRATISMLILLIVATGGGIWYSKRTHFNEHFTRQIKKELKRKDSDFLYKSDLGLIEEVTVTDKEELNYLSSFPKLKTVRVEKITLDVDDMNKYLNRVETLSLYECNLSGQEKPTSFPKLKALALNGIHITDTAFFNGMSRLEHFSNNTAPIVEVDQKKTLDLAFLQNCKELNELRLDKSTYTHANVIEALPKLKSLLITGSSLSTGSLDWKKLDLNWLYVEDINQNALDNIATGSRIKCFNMKLLNEVQINLMSLSKISGIEKLYICGEIPKETDHIKEYLKPRITGYDCIYKIPTLKNVEVSGCNVNVKFPK